MSVSVSVSVAMSVAMSVPVPMAMIVVGFVVASPFMPMSMVARVVAAVVARSHHQHFLLHGVLHRHQPAVEVHVLQLWSVLDALLAVRLARAALVLYRRAIHDPHEARVGVRVDGLHVRAVPLVGRAIGGLVHRLQHELLPVGMSDVTRSEARSTADALAWRHGPRADLGLRSLWRQSEDGAGRGLIGRVLARGPLPLAEVPAVHSEAHAHPGHAIPLPVLVARRSVGRVLLVEQVEPHILGALQSSEAVVGQRRLQASSSVRVGLSRASRIMQVGAEGEAATQRANLAGDRRRRDGAIRAALQRKGISQQRRLVGPPKRHRVFAADFWKACDANWRLCGAATARNAAPTPVFQCRVRKSFATPPSAPHAALRALVFGARDVTTLSRGMLC
mmetsp:Transcript_1827/g.8006  ORF Transcript_1827/g.8006 Transcript_1827/m.8006 type:complete len:391 (-) Transcript_1827:58-1230(-)